MTILDGSCPVFLIKLVQAFVSFIIVINILFLQAIYETRTILLMVIMRVIYVPLFLCSNSSLHKYLPTIIHSDTVFIIMMASFAASNGYITNTLITSAPRYVNMLLFFFF